MDVLVTWKLVVTYVTGKASQLFTSVLYNNYSPPPGFCFDVLCDDEPFIDDKHSPDYNVDKLVCFIYIIWKTKEGLVNIETFIYHVHLVVNKIQLLNQWTVMLQVSRFVDYVETQANFYSTNNILLTMGGDFTYQGAHIWYKNLDKLIR